MVFNATFNNISVISWAVSFTCGGDYCLIVCPSYHLFIYFFHIAVEKFK